MRIDEQITLADVDREYSAFVEKFKPKKTTDDCYTPTPIYDAVLGFVVSEYGIDPGNVVRPFWPGGDYLREDYPDGCTVVDNPPFSIISQICKTYQAAGIKFFLFAPYLTNMSTDIPGVCHIITDARITYENGAVVNTAFLTNLDPCLMRTAPELQAAIEAADRTGRPAPLPSYQYPRNVVTATRLGYLSRYGVSCSIYPDEAMFVRGLDSQREKGKSIFGAGYLVGGGAADRVEQAEKEADRIKAVRPTAPGGVPVIEWPLSEREQAWVRELTRRNE